MSSVDLLAPPLFLTAVRPAIAAAIRTLRRRAPQALGGAGFLSRADAAHRRAERSALIVGGDIWQRRFCETLLRAMGLTVAVAADYRQALRALREASYGMIIVDTAEHGEPVMDPVALLETLQSGLGRASQVYLVSDAATKVAGARGACRMLERPLRAVQLVEAAERAWR